MPLRSLAFLAYFLGSAAVSMAIPMVGVVCYIVLYHVYPQTTWWGQFLQPMEIRYSYIIGICLMIGSVLNLNRLKFGRRFIHPIEWCILVIFLTMLLSTATGVAWNNKTEFLLDKMSKVFLFTFLLSHVVVTRRQIWHLVVLLTLMTLYLGHEAHIAPVGSFDRNRLNGIGGPDFRESAGLAIHLLAMLPFVAILLRQRKRWLQALAFFAACYGMNAILLCRARSAFLAGMIAGVLSVGYIPRQHRRWVVVVLMMAAIGGFALSDQDFWDRMQTIFSSVEERDQSAASRLVIWTAAWEMIKDNPMGVGIGQFSRNSARYSTSQDVDILRRDAHNTFVLCAGETGIPGLAAFLLTLAIAWRTLSRLNREVKAKLSNPALFEMFIFANRMALLVYIVAGMFVSRFYTEGWWWLVILPVCISRAVHNEIRAEARQEVYELPRLRELNRIRYANRRPRRLRLAPGGGSH